MSTLAQQASAVEQAVRVVSGSALKPSAKEREYITALLKEAAETLRELDKRPLRA